MDLSTTYLGKALRTPLVVSASPLSEKISGIRSMEDAGASAVVLYSLFEEQLVLEEQELFYHTMEGTESHSEATSYFPTTDEYKLGPDEYLRHIEKAKEAVDIPIIASLNGSSIGGWTSYAKEIEAVGADCLELNIYYIPSDIYMTGEEVESNYVQILESVRSNVKIPVSVKLSPYFSNLANLAMKLSNSGANGLVLFNRFYQPDINLEELEVEPNVLLSKSMDLRLPMRWIAMLSGSLNLDFAATSGIHTGRDVIKMMMVGANVAMLNSVLLKKGINQIARIEEEIVRWMEENEYVSIEQMQGSMNQQNISDPSTFERAQYMKAITRYKI